MALATTALSEARAKIEAAEADSQQRAGQSAAQDALSLAGEALVEARRAGDGGAKLEALEVVVRAQMHLGDYFAANLAATDELAMIRRTGDGKAEARALQLLADVRTARGDGAGAAESLQGALALHREAGDRRGQAEALRALAKARLASGKKSEALAPAEDAVKLFVELGDKEGEETATRIVNLVYAEKNQLDKAPGRPQALQALKDLSTAIDDRDSRRWTLAMEELTRTGAYTQRDVDSVVDGALEKDRAASATFLEEQGVVVKGAGAPELQMKEANKTVQYINFRLGGLNYGPRFRCLTAYRAAVQGNLDSLHAVCCLQVSDQADDWETQLQFHPGVLDSMVQSGSCYGL